MISNTEVFEEPYVRRISLRLSLLIVILLSAVGWWLFFPILSALISLYGIYMVIAVIVLGLVRILLSLYKESTRGVVTGGYYLSD